MLRRPTADPVQAERLRTLARPSLGQWWGLARGLLPALAEQEVVAGLGKLILDGARDDLPRAAGLDGVLREALDGEARPRTTVRVNELFDRLIRFRNEEIGHGATGQRPSAFYERLGTALLAGVAELLGAADVLGGRRLIHVSDVPPAGLGCMVGGTLRVAGRKCPAAGISGGPRRCGRPVAAPRPALPVRARTHGTGRERVVAASVGPL